MKYFQHNPASNCAADLAMVLSTVPEAVKGSPTLADTINLFTPQQQPLVIDSTDYRNWQLSEQNTLRYICGYLIQKCLRKHSCEVCLQFANACGELAPDTLFCYFKNYDTEGLPFGQLNMPDQQFIHYISQLENIYTTSFPAHITKPRVGYFVKCDLLQATLDHPCPHFPHEYLTTLFVRMRIFYTLKYHNREQKSLPKKNRKRLILGNL